MTVFRRIFNSYIILLLIIFLSFSCKKSKEDETSPVITLEGDNPQTTGVNVQYEEPGYKATDDKDGDITSKVEVTDNINVSVTGTYTRKYNVKDNAGNAAQEKTREVRVIHF